MKHGTTEEMPGGAMRFYQEAEKSYDKAIAIKPDKYSSWINRGIALTKLQRYEQEECILRQSYCN